MKPDIIVHWQHDGRLYCEDRETPLHNNGVPGQVLMTCAVCFGRDARPHPQSTSTGERVR